MLKMYLYLCRRDRSAAQLVLAVQGVAVRGPVRITNLADLRLDGDVMAGMVGRRDWDLWLEGAESLPALERAVRGRGVKYFDRRPAHPLNDFNSPHVADTRRAEVVKTMVRKATPAARSTGAAAGRRTPPGS